MVTDQLATGFFRGQAQFSVQPAGVECVDPTDQAQGVNGVGSSDQVRGLSANMNLATWTEGCSCLACR